MYKRFFNWLTHFPKTVVFFAILIITASLWIAWNGLFPGGNLNIDTSSKPFVEEKSAYDSNLVTKGRFVRAGKEDQDESTKTLGEEKIDPNKKPGGVKLSLVFTPQNKVDFDLDTFLKLDQLNKELSADPDIYRNITLLDTLRVKGFCKGKSFIKVEVLGNVCESVIENYYKQLDCIQNREKHLQAIEALHEEEEENLGFGDDGEELEEEPEEENAFSNSFVCTREMLNKSKQDIYEETDQKIAGIFEEIKRTPILHKRIISGDFKSSLVTMEFTKGHNLDRKITKDKINYYLKKMNDWGWKTAWLSGQRYDNAIRDSILKDIKNILPIAVLLMLFSLFLSFRSIGGTFIPFLVVTMSLTMTAAVMGFTGIAMNTVTVALPALLICVGNDYAIHFLTYYYQNARANPDGNKKELVLSILDRLITPLSVTALTTVVGFSALMISDIPAIRQLGLFASVGVILSIFMTLTFLPALLILLPKPKPRPVPVRKKNGNSTFDRYLKYLVKIVEKYPVKVMWAWGIITIVAAIGIGLVKIDGDANPLSADHPMEKDRIYFWDNYVGDNTLLLYFEPLNESVDLRSAEFINGLINLKRWVLQEEQANAIGDLKGLRVDRVDSPIDYIEIYRNGLDNLKDKEVRNYFENAGPKYKFPIFISSDRQLMRTYVRFGSDNNPDTLALPELLKKKCAELLPNFKVHLRGRAILVGEAQNNLATGQIESISLAMFFVFIILSLLFMSVKMGALAVLPNIIPVVIFFGTLGYANIPIGFTISLIAAIVLGIGVDDTIHYLTHFHSNLKKIRNEREAALVTVGQVGRPMTYTTISLGLGFIIFLLSDMFQQRIFGVLTTYIFIVCLATDLNFLPSVMSKVKLITFWDFLGLKFDKKALEKISMFNNMTVRESKLATLMAYTQELKKGERLFKEGDIGDELFVVLKGGMDIFLDEDIHGKRVQLVHLGVGEPFGEMGLFRESRRSASSVATAQTQLLVLKKSVLERLQKRYPKIATKLFYNLAANLSSSISRNSRILAQRKSHIIRQMAENPEKFRDRLESITERILEKGIDNLEEKAALQILVRSDVFTSLKEVNQIDRLKEYIDSKIKEDEKRIADFVDSIIEDGVITYDDKKKLDRMVYEDHHVTEGERNQVKRLNAAIESGKVSSQIGVFGNIFQNMKPSQVKWLKSHFEIKDIPAGSRIYSEGDYGDYLLVSLKGKFNLYKNVDGQPTAITTLFEGDLVGVVSLLCSQANRTSSVITQEGATVMFISSKGLIVMEEKKPSLAARFYYNTICMLSDRLAELNAELYG